MAKKQSTKPAATETPAQAPVKKAAAKKAVKKVVKKAAKKATPDGASAEIVYPEVAVKICYGTDAMTYEDAQKLLGWEEESEGKDFSQTALFTDYNGKRIRCWNNDRNRPFSLSDAKTIAQEVLRKNWKENGENLIIGKTGVTISAQHRLVGFCLAVQEWRRNKEAYPQWETEPTFPTLVVVGIEESDEVVNTIDTGRPRSLTDAIYRSEYFVGMGSSERRKIARICDYAIRTLWHRTGVDRDAFGLKRTHTESLDFLARHDHLLEAVRHVYEEEGGDKKKISLYLGGGYSAGLLYLMGTSKTDRTTYRAADPHSEHNVDFSLWEKACEFFTLLAGGDKKLGNVRQALGDLVTAGRATIAARHALVVKAWNAWLADGKPTLDALGLHFVTNDDGEPVLAECPTVGGIDVGSPIDAEDEADNPTQDQIEQEKEKLNKESAEKKLASGPPVFASVTEADIGHTVWIKEEPIEGSWCGTLVNVHTGLQGKVATIKVGKGFAQAGKEIQTQLARVSLRKPVAEGKE